MSVQSVLQRLSGLSGSDTPPSPKKRPKRRSRGPQVPYTHDLDAPLLHLSRKDAWSLRDAVAGVHAFGSNGSGKTSATGRALAHAYLKAGMGGLVLCARPDERALWEDYAAEAGRSEHLFVVDDTVQWRFNFMAYEMHRPAAGEDHIKRVENLVSTFANVLEQTGGDLSGSDEQVWAKAATRILRAALMVVSAGARSFGLAELNEFIDAAPRDDNDAQLFLAGDASGAFADYMDRAGSYYRDGGMEGDFRLTHRYWTNEFPNMADKTRASVMFTLATMLDDLQTGTLRRLFNTDSTLFPDDSHAGAIIVLDLPATNSRSNVAAQVLFKSVWQQALLRRMKGVTHNGKTLSYRPCFLFADEAHFFINEKDNDFLSVSRAAGACPLSMTQNLNSYYQRVGGSQPEATAKALLGYFQTHVFHAQSDPDTVKWAQELFGKRDIHKASYSETSGGSRNRSRSDGYRDEDGNNLGQQSDAIADSTTSTVTYNTVTEDAIRPEVFNGLAIGGPANGNVVEALVYRSGRMWLQTQSPLMRLQFTQRS